MPSMNHSIQFSGGSEKIDFLVSGRFNEQLGMMQINQDKNTAFNLRAKIEARLTPWLTLSNNLQFATNTYKYPGSGSRGDINTSFEIGRAACRERVCQACRSRGAPIH